MIAQAIRRSHLLRRAIEYGKDASYARAMGDNDRALIFSARAELAAAYAARAGR